MIFNYDLHKLNFDDSTFTYIVKIYKNELYFKINLLNFPKYIFIHNQYKEPNRYYKVIKLYNCNNNKNILGDIKKINIEKYIKNRSNTKEIIFDKCLYKICHQTDFDKYYYLNNIKNDNSKLFETIYKYIINYYKNLYNKELEYINKIKKKIRIFQYNNKIYKETLI